MSGDATTGGPSATAPVDAVVFDIGGVLIDWDPRHLYRQVIRDEIAMERFLAEVCTRDWHRQHDLGVPFSITIPRLAAAHPEWAAEIRAYSDRFAEMWVGPMPAVEVLASLRAAGTPTYGATNWPAETWEQARRLFDFLNWFDGCLVSGEAGVAKPSPRFFDLLVERFKLVPPSTLYVDDHADNLAPAEARGFVTHRFRTVVELVEDLRVRGLLGPA